MKKPENHTSGKCPANNCTGGKRDRQHKISNGQLERIPTETAWDSLSAEDKKMEARRMEIYAAMVDDLDQYIGEVLESLKNNGDFKNTFIFFIPSISFPSFSKSFNQLRI